MKTIKCDICVIGGGAGGLAFAAGAVQMGASVVLVEKHKMGGDCLNYGCVPSKAMIAAGQLAHDMRHANTFGLPATAVRADLQKVHKHIANVIAAIAPHDSVERFEELGCQVIKASGSFLDRKTLLAGTKTVRAKYFVIATGSHPFIPPMEGVKETPYFTNETIFSHQEDIKHLIVIGGGPIGLELAQSHLRLGAKVSVIERGSLLAHEDSELVPYLTKKLESEGMAIHQMCSITRLSGSGGKVQVEVSQQPAEERKTITGSHLLIATGRIPQLAGLQLDKANIDYTRRGIVVDDKLRTSRKRIYAIGDCSGAAQFTHVAGYHAGIAIRNILFSMRTKASLHNLPLVTYCDPELASLGLSERAAREKYGDSVKTISFDYDENDRAQATHNTQGRIKVFLHKNKILGVAIVGSHAGEMLAPWIIAREAGLKIGQMAGAIFPYPTLSEINKRVAGQAFTEMLFSKRMRGFIRTLLAFRTYI